MAMDQAENESQTTAKDLPALMQSVFSVYMQGLTDVGRARDHNEDAISWDESSGLSLLADGMGGHNAGDVASRICIEQLREHLLDALHKPLRLTANKNMSKYATLMRRAVSKANEAIFNEAAANPERKGMGTTLVAVLFYKDKVVITHVGDSRVYRLRGAMLMQMTEDHSLVHDLLEKGVISADEVANNPYSHVITKAVGIREKVVAEVQEVDAHPGDVFLLCSDGLSDLVDDKMIEQTLVAAAGNWSAAAQRLIDLANQQGGRDNISVVLAALGGPR
jgi:PPM family protein phosphatase